VDKPSALAGLGRAVGRTRYAVLVAVAAVLLVSVTLFLLGGAQDASIVIRAWADTFQDGKFGSTDLTVEFLAVIGVMLRAVVMYLIGVGLYSLFVEPLNLTAALGVESLVDLETKVISVVVVILAVTFLQHFIRWEDPLATLRWRRVGPGQRCPRALPGEQPTGQAVRQDACARRAEVSGRRVVPRRPGGACHRAGVQIIRSVPLTRSA